MHAPSVDLQRRVEAMLKQRTLAWHKAIGGYTNAQRWVVALNDGSCCFVKAGGDSYTAEQLRAEYGLYGRLEATWLPQFLGWQDHDDAPILLLDLSDAHWPPPWHNGQIERVRAALDDVHRTDAQWLPRIRELENVEEWPHFWKLVVAQPEEFLSLGLCTLRWLEQAAPKLIDAAVAAPLDGDALIHLDIRSDNLCFVGHRVVIIDWNFACVGNPDVDLACWLPSLQAEGGPTPESILPKSPELAALVAGYFALYAGKRRNVVRDIQKEQVRTALPWAVRALGLPPLDGPS